MSDGQNAVIQKSFIVGPKRSKKCCYGKERMPEKERSHIKESPYSILIPLILAVPSVSLGEYFLSSTCRKMLDCLVIL